MNETNVNQEKEVFQKMIAVKFKGSKKAYHFGTNDENYKYGDQVVVETIRGIEMGEAISDLRDCAEHHMSIPLKPVLRKATPRDIADYERNKKDEPAAMAKCQVCIDRLHLDMNLISAEYTLDRSKVIFSYVSDERVDFRELLKELAVIFKCRIELRQIGPRDKAKIVGGLGPCGMETCCSRFLEEFDVISINMAKNQLLALNIQKLSGQCGKLMCCLRYEDDVYKECRKGLPKMNAHITYQNEHYRLTGMNIMDGTAKLSNKENAVTITLEELKTLMNQQPEPAANNKSKGQQNTKGKQGDRHEKSKELSK